MVLAVLRYHAIPVAKSAEICYCMLLFVVLRPLPGVEIDRCFLPDDRNRKGIE
jgi:hypothetical protein